LLNQFEEIATIVVISEQMDAVDNEDQWSANVSSSLQCNLLQLVERAFDVE
jgi:hypothetical protein